MGVIKPPDETESFGATAELMKNRGRKNDLRDDSSIDKLYLIIMHRTLEAPGPAEQRG